MSVAVSAPPLVSIAIPAYNHAQFIEACLASVCAQTYPELELVLIDDGSTDDTFALAQRFLAAHRDRFRRIVLEHRQNQGVSANSNACIEACQAEWVHLLGSDDVLRPDKVERIQCAIADWNCPDLAMVHADCDYIGADGGPVAPTKPKPRPQAGPDHAAWRWLFLGEHHVINPTIDPIPRSAWSRCVAPGAGRCSAWSGGWRSPACCRKSSRAPKRASCRW